MAQVLRYGESDFWFVSSYNRLGVFAAIWPYFWPRNLAVRPPDGSNLFGLWLNCGIS